MMKSAAGSKRVNGLAVVAERRFATSAVLAVGQEMEVKGCFQWVFLAVSEKKLAKKFVFRSGCLGNSKHGQTANHLPIMAETDFVAITLHNRIEHDNQNIKHQQMIRSSS